MGQITAVQACTILAGASGLSDAVNLGDKALCGIEMSAGWVTAALTFQWSLDGVAWYELIDSGGTAVSVAAPAQATAFTLTLASFAPVVWIKLRSGTAAQPVNRTATRVLKLLTRKFYPTR